MYRQKFIPAIKNVAEEKKKLKTLVKFHCANKIDNYNRAGKKGEKKKNPNESTEQIKT